MHLVSPGRGLVALALAAAAAVHPARAGHPGIGRPVTTRAGEVPCGKEEDPKFWTKAVRALDT